MTHYATHRFNVGQQVAHSGSSPGSCEVMAKNDGPDGPEYRVRFLDGSVQAGVAERDLTYALAVARTDPGSPRGT
jgi:hypothetical protein